MYRVKKYQFWNTIKCEMARFRNKRFPLGKRNKMFPAGERSGIMYRKLYLEPERLLVIRVCYVNNQQALPGE